MSPSVLSVHKSILIILFHPSFLIAWGVTGKTRIPMMLNHDQDQLMGLEQSLEAQYRETRNKTDQDGEVSGNFWGLSWKWITAIQGFYSNTCTDIA